MPAFYDSEPDCAVDEVNEPLWNWHSIQTQYVDQDAYAPFTGGVPPHHLSAVPVYHPTGWPMPSHFVMPTSNSQYCQQEPSLAVLSCPGDCCLQYQDDVALNLFQSQNSQVYGLEHDELMPEHAVGLNLPSRRADEQELHIRSKIKAEPFHEEQEMLVGLGLYNDSTPASNPLSPYQPSLSASEPVTCGRKSLLLGEGWEPPADLKQEFEEAEYYSDSEDLEFETSVAAPSNTEQLEAYSVQTCHSPVHDDGQYYQPAYHSGQSDSMPGGMGPVMGQGSGWNTYAYPQQECYGSYL